MTLALAAHWADLHAADPQLGPGGRRAWCGEDRLIDLGGDGTPMVQELCLAELAISRRVHPHAPVGWWPTRWTCATGSRPGGQAVHELRLEAWLARKAATLCRDLDVVAVRTVDAALPEDLGEVSPARILEVVKATVIAADPKAHAAKLAEEKRRRYVSLSRTDEFGLRHVIARVRAGDAVWVDAMVDRVADLLAPRFPEGTTKDVLRSEAFGWLARPAELLQLLLDGVPEPTMDQADLAKAIRSIDPAKLRRWR